MFFVVLLFGWFSIYVHSVDIYCVCPRVGNGLGRGRFCLGLAGFT